MQFLVKAYDGENMLEKRMEVRPRHLEGMKSLSEQVICAGGLLDEAGKMKGSSSTVGYRASVFAIAPGMPQNAMAVPVGSIMSMTARCVWRFREQRKR